MDAAVAASRSGWVAQLRSFVQASDEAALCELCSAPIAPDHRHLLDPAARQLVCACAACALLFSAREGTKFLLVPERSERLSDFRMSDAQWERLGIPIGIAFFVRSTSRGGRIVAMYPGAAGATDSALDLDGWDEVQRDNPLLASLEPDVEALLVNRIGATREHYRVSIDRCFALVGLIRSRWRGVSGGAAANQAIGEFFARLDGRERLHA